MYRLESVPGGPVGLTLLDREERRPGLVLESSRSGRLRLRAGEQTLLWARVERGYWGLWIARGSQTQSQRIVRPIRASEARRWTTLRDWMRFFGTELEGSPRSPLSRGTWQLTELAPSTSPDVLVPCDVDGMPLIVRGLLAAPTAPRVMYVDWSNVSKHEVTPLRAFSAPDAARVKAWRKHAREHSLPPVLLWAWSDLATILIDGHDRLLAAVLEGVMPRALVLWQSLDRPDPDVVRRRTGAAESYEKAFRRAGALSEATRADLTSALVRAFRDGVRTAVTTARAVPDLDEVWAAEVSEALAGDDDLPELLEG